MQGDTVLDARGQLCPMPILNMDHKVKEIQPGQVLEVLADDEGAHADVRAWCAKTGHEFLGEENVDGYTRYFIRKVA